MTTSPASDISPRLPRRETIRKAREYSGPLGILAAGAIGLSLLCSVSVMAIGDLKRYIPITLEPISIVDFAVSNLETAAAMTEQAVTIFVPTETLVPTGTPAPSLSPQPTDTQRQFVTITPTITRRARITLTSVIIPSRTPTSRPPTWTPTRPPPTFTKTNTPRPPTVTPITPTEPTTYPALPTSTPVTPYP